MRDLRTVQFFHDGAVASARRRRTEFVRLRARYGRREIKHSAIFVNNQPEKADGLAQVDGRFLIWRRACHLRERE